MAKERGTKGVVDTRPGPGIDTSLDELAKGLASGTVSRGKALRWMGGALVGAALASIPGVAWADGGRCPTGRTRCNDNCVNLQTSERHCGSCGNRCRSTQTCCKGNCVNTQANERHCGGCFNRCDEGEECVNGVCEGGGGCLGGTTPCGTGTSVICCQTGETCLENALGGPPTCCPNAQLCGTGCCPPPGRCVGGQCAFS
jgi:hypothetical protein